MTRKSKLRKPNFIYNKLLRKSKKFFQRNDLDDIYSLMWLSWVLLLYCWMLTSTGSERLTTWYQLVFLKNRLFYSVTTNATRRIALFLVGLLYWITRIIRVMNGKKSSEITEKRISKTNGKLGSEEFFTIFIEKGLFILIIGIFGSISQNPFSIFTDLLFLLLFLCGFITRYIALTIKQHSSFLNEGKISMFTVAGVLGELGMFTGWIALTEKLRFLSVLFFLYGLYDLSPLVSSWMENKYGKQYESFEKSLHQLLEQTEHQQQEYSEELLKSVSLLEKKTK